MIEHLRDKALGVGFACRVLGLSESAYYARRKRPKSARRLRDEQLMPLIEQVHADSGGTHGVRRITRALRRKGVHVARCTVERLMAELGLEGVIRIRTRLFRHARDHLLAQSARSTRQCGGEARAPGRGGRGQEPPALPLFISKDLPLALHGVRVSSSARDSLRRGLPAAAGTDRTLKLWIVDSVGHFSRLTDDGPDTAATMAELHFLAWEYHLAVLVTSRVVTEHPDEPVTAAHLPAGMAEHSDQVLVLDRPGACCTHTPSAAATLRRLTGPAPGRPVERELQPDRCRFVPA
ncbi:IS3 family transposase [Streptomyces sp. NPDC088766]|uniref:IS3 family transposase n=1 Tax=Streptomyces sp. NPDC088766 TaxID=3365893 RepID=UPI00381D37BC